MASGRKAIISIVVPVFNERESLEELVSRLTTTLRTTKVPFELLLIDDNSTDGSYELIKKLAQKHPIRLIKKTTQKGKAFSLLEGFKHAQGQVIGMIDADLQYAPEEIAPMIQKLAHADIVVANRKIYKASSLRRIGSKALKLLIGKYLFKLDHDIQAGLKVFRREVLDIVHVQSKSPWTFDLEFLHKAAERSFRIANHDISFEARKFGSSKINFLSNALEIGINAVVLRLRKLPPHPIAPKNGTSMLGAGVIHRRNKYVTHTTLPHTKSAIFTFSTKQKVALLCIVILLAICFFTNTLLTFKIVIGILSAIYFIDVAFNFLLVFISLRNDQEITFSEKELTSLSEKNLPVYSVLCPLYKELHVLPQFLEAIQKIQWPKSKLDVLLLLEEDDTETLTGLKDITLPSYVRTIIVPNSNPKTKPKACNYGLSHAKGEYLVIFDAEDIPDPLQLIKAYIGFQKVDKKVICLQAKLNYYNPHQNLLTRLFTAEYSLWFDLTLTGLQSMNTSIPLGGTSNHFRTPDLRALQGWDPFNVAEDADLGVRLFRQGYRTAIIDSTTLEEASSNVKNWIRQRSRWIKGYMQTYLLHIRDLFTFTRTNGVHAFIFQLTIGGKIMFILINPILWIATIAYFVLYAQVGAAIESVYPTFVFYMAATSLIFGNFLFIYCYMIGCIKREQWSVVKYAFFVPIYWILISIAASISLYQLIFKPHYWEKTLHGHHLKNKKKPQSLPKVVTTTVQAKPKSSSKLSSFTFPSIVLPHIQFPTIKIDFLQKLGGKQLFVSGAVLIVATMLINILNFAYNAYLGRLLTFDDFGVLSLISSLLFLGTIPFNALIATVNFRVAYMEGKYGKNTAYTFWKDARKKIAIIGAAVSLLWIISSPFLANFFHTPLLVIITFAPVWLFGFITSVDRGYLNGKLLFGHFAIVVLTEAVIKFVLAMFFIMIGHPELAYLSVTLSVILSYQVGGWIIAYISNKEKKITNVEEIRFPYRFFLASFLTGISTVSVISYDVMLAKHYLLPIIAGEYAIVSLIGKMIYFFSALATQFIIPLVSRNEGAKKDSQKTLLLSFVATFVLSFGSYVVFGLASPITAPLLFGNKVNELLVFIPGMCFAIMCFSMSRVFISYYLAKRIYSFLVIALLASFLQIAIVVVNHSSIQSFVLAVLISSLFSLGGMFIFHIYYMGRHVIHQNVRDLRDLFTKKTNNFNTKTQRTSVLIFNWRDTKHIWAGGAEAYIHELAKQWVNEGIQVTVFSGNDGKHARNEVVDGVQIIRRGGFYTVYIWAFLYYIFRLRNQYDVIIDSENGIPFFTPLYVRKPIFLLVHHIHQEVFRNHLKFPFSFIAQSIEGIMMPIVYGRTEIITVSNSSKKEIVKLGLGSDETISVIHPGIDFKSFTTRVKTKHPSFVYLGRLKPYKNIDTAILAFKQILKRFDNATLTIAGSGEELSNLKTIVSQEGLNNSVTFVGAVSEKDKRSLLAKSWIALQPSSIEGWGITVIEANASGTPVIASNVNGLKDSIVHNKTGILVKPRNVDELAKAMESCINSTRLRNTLTKNAYEWAQEFSWERSASKFYRAIHARLSLVQKTELKGELAYAPNE